MKRGREREQERGTTESKEEREREREREHERRPNGITFFQGYANKHRRTVSFFFLKYSVGMTIQLYTRRNTFIG